MRRIFISYHHADQDTKDQFVTEFSRRLSQFTDGSLDNRVDSTQPDYVQRRIREEYITGTSATIVLCGEETWKRRYVDWEIHATLQKRHGLLGIVVPGTSSVAGRYQLPDRLNDNIGSYARLYSWPGTQDLPAWIEAAITASARISPSNARVQMTYNRT